MQCCFEVELQQKCRQWWKKQDYTLFFYKNG
nr:MAG TPA: hypothetical protein [Caudoviricetes sp.]